jgi:ABC-2 type transport system ATP-binding protein
VTIAGQPFTRAAAQRLRRRIGFLTESPGLWDRLTVDDNVRVYARLFGLARPGAAVERVLRLFDLWGRRADAAGVLSKGMRQKLALARALVHDPEVILLDEPTANLDPETSRRVRDLLAELKRAGRAVIVSTHNLDEIDRIADRVALISGTVIAIGEPAALRRDVFGRRLRVRVAEPAATMPLLAAAAARAGAHDVSIDANVLTMALDSLDGQTPAVVRALVDAGAHIREVGEAAVALEDVYLRLLGEDGRGAGSA